MSAHGWPRCKDVGQLEPSSSGPRHAVLARAGLGLALTIISLGAWHTAIAGAQVAPKTFEVNRLADTSDSRVGDGVCASFGGGCSLRAAIDESNALPGTDTINILPGFYELEIPVFNEDSDASGDYDIRDSVIIDGAGATGTSATILDGGFPPEGATSEQRGMDRLFEIHPTALNVTISKLTIREGFSD